MRTRFVAALGVIALLATAWGGAASRHRRPRTAAPTTAPASAPGESAVPSAAAGSYLERALAGEFKGKHVTATGPAVDADAVKMNGP